MRQCSGMSPERPSCHGSRVQLTKAFRAAQYEEALESWSSLDFTGKKPLFASLFGDVFFQSTSGVWQLDILDGVLVQRYADEEAMSSALASNAGQDEVLIAWLAREAQAQDLVLGPDEVYDLIQPPVLGGSLEVGNLKPMDFVVAVNIAGQLHEQVRGLPPGIAIGKIHITEP